MTVRATFTEDQLLPLSALQHLLFCPRQCALIHIEQAWADNEFTAQGNVLHEKAHGGPDESRPGLRTVRGLPVRSFTLGVSGQCDVVEFHRDGTVFPVEYKRGKPKRGDEDRVQLCAQAICLEETLSTKIPAGALFYGQKRQRQDVPFTPDLRATTAAAAADLHDLIASQRTPIARREPKCDSCSLLEICMPDAMRLSRGAKSYNDRQFAAALDET